ncbi:MAG TPA: MmcQ/YjbR family DNA-binding protein [Candidatus Acidoferrales bacterium]|nr:MmcQ/YjbR family DNA-binding protein [Candidatus Acidoferrales bacterium]
MANIEWVRKYCKTLAGTTEQIQWEDDLLFKVGGKMFAAMPLELGGAHMNAPWVSFKCTAEEFAELTERPGIRPAAYLARAQWVSVESEEALPRAEVERLLRQSYELVMAKLTKKRREAVMSGQWSVTSVTSEKRKKKKVARGKSKRKR